LAGGWGYSALASYFLSEDAQTFANSRQAHWDTMSYTIYSLPQYTRFSDIYTMYLRPQFSGAAQASVVAASLPAVTLSKLSSGILVFDDTSASQTQSLFTVLGAQETAGTSAMAVSTSTTAAARAYVAPVAPAVDPLLGLDPSKGDPDDVTPEPPKWIITKVPAISGVTVYP
jgi:hypothetical protein